MTFPPPTSRGSSVAPLIDHTLLQPDATRPQILRLCDEASHYGFAAVCVNPVWLALIVPKLADSPVHPCVVLDFPLGAAPTAIREHAARDYVRHGARELDVVLAVAALKEKRYADLLRDIRAVVSAAAGRTVKVILETARLTDDEKRRACEIAVEAGAHFVKTSTGFAGGGATIEDVRLMRAAVGPTRGVKASGGIRTLDQALHLIEAGANRIGTSAGIAIVTAEP